VTRLPLKTVSFLGFVLMVAGVLGLIAARLLFSWSPAVIALQVAALALMIWARVTFGLRSFHATANPTRGRLVTHGPYRFIRHPIYTAVLLFALAGAVAHLSPLAVGLVALVLAGVAARIVSEEHLLQQRYPEYAEYAARTSRIVPFVF
jgi:protein-S-isoprenylcysteine O-methyltransferase Ste14